MTVCLLWTECGILFCVSIHCPSVRHGVVTLDCGEFICHTEEVSLFCTPYFTAALPAQAVAKLYSAIVAERLDQKKNQQPTNDVGPMLDFLNSDSWQLEVNRYCASVMETGANGRSGRVRVFLTGAN